MEEKKYERKEEKERIERLEVARIKSKESKLKHIERNKDEGMERIPEKERNRLMEEDKRKRKIKLKETKEDIWKLRGRENKLVETPTSRNICKLKEMQHRSAELIQIMKAEKEKLEKDKKKDDQDEKKRTETKYEKIKKQQKVKERLEICKLITTYLELSNGKWEQDNIDMHKQHEKKKEENTSNKKTEKNHKPTKTVIIDEKKTESKKPDRLGSRRGTWVLAMC